MANLRVCICFYLPLHPFLTRLLVSDRLLEVTGTISASEQNKQVLDKLEVERERGNISLSIQLVS
jgi:translation elongation factor EF-4